MQGARPIRLTIKNIFANLPYYWLTVAILPYALLRAENSFGIVRTTSTILRIEALILGVAGAALQGWCIVLLQRAGQGTPSPVFPTRGLVVAWPYRILRNPLNLGELMVLASLAAWFSSLALLICLLLAFLALPLFVVVWEEPANCRRFGEEFRRYAASVNWWVPRMGV